MLAPCRAHTRGEHAAAPRAAAPHVPRRRSNSAVRCRSAPPAPPPPAVDACGGTAVCVPAGRPRADAIDTIVQLYARLATWLPLLTRYHKSCCLGGAEELCACSLRRPRCRRAAAMRLGLLLAVRVRRRRHSAPRRAPQGSAGAAASMNVAAQPALRSFSWQLAAALCLVAHALSWRLRAPPRRRRLLCCALLPRSQTPFPFGWRLERALGWSRRLQSPGFKAQASLLRWQ